MKHRFLTCGLNLRNVSNLSTLSHVVSGKLWCVAEDYPQWIFRYEQGAFSDFSLPCRAFRNIGNPYSMGHRIVRSFCLHRRKTVGHQRDGLTHQNMIRWVETSVMDGCGGPFGLSPSLVHPSKGHRRCPCENVPRAHYGGGAGPVVRRLRRMSFDFLFQCPGCF